MNKNIIKLAGLALAAAFAISAKADVAIHQNVSVYGYAAGSVRYDKDNGANSATSMDLDAAKLGFAFNFAPVTAKVSLFNDGGDDIYVLEANATYDIGNGWSLTGGRYQSWLGYEAFDIPNGNFITNGASGFNGVSNVIPGFQLIPNFHEGVKIEYTFDKSTIGFSVVDSVYTTGNYRADGMLSDNYGVEARYAYNDGAFSLQATAAYQNEHGGSDVDSYIGDLWAQYTVKNTTFGGEIYYTHTDDTNIWYGLAMVKQQMNEKFSLAGRLSAGKIEDANFWKVSAQPAYAVTKNLSVGAEVSYTKYNDDFQVASGTKSNLFVGVQACFKF